MMKYQVMPDKCVSVNFVMEGFDNKDTRCFEQSKKLFSFLKKDKCVMTPKTIEGIRSVLRNRYPLKDRAINDKIDILMKMATVKPVDMNVFNRKICDVANFLYEFHTRGNTDYINISQVTPRYRGIVTSCVPKYRLIQPEKEDRVFLAEVLCLANDCDQTYLATYDRHFIEAQISYDIEKKFGIVTGHPKEILEKIKHH